MKANFIAARKCNAINYPHTNLEAISKELHQECRLCTADGRLSKSLRDKLTNLTRDNRREIVKRSRDGCAPLFLVCKRGNVEIAEFLVTNCDADTEQRGMFENPEDQSVHCVTPLWCAAVSAKIPIVRFLVKLGADINALSDTGSTPVRSACFMTNIDVVKYLVEHGADIKKSNYNGGTCLINSVQSVELCSFLISKGADVNARDIQNKTALHYAIQEHRLETTELLLDNGANPFAKSRYGDDALQTACLKGAHHIFNHLKSRISYSTERLANANELIGSTYLDENNELRLAILHWKLALHIRLKECSLIEKTPAVPLRVAYGNTTEFITLAELDNISTDVDAMRIQSLLICERVLGIQHTDTLFRLMFRGASYADSLRFQRCIDLWHLALQVRVDAYSILYSDTCFTAHALVRLMLDLHDKSFELEPNDFVDADVPRFRDVIAIFDLLTNSIFEAKTLLQVKPVYRKQQENFDRVLKCVTHLIYLLVSTAKSDTEKATMKKAVEGLIQNDVRSACTKDTLLHLCVSRLNVIKSGYFSDGTSLIHGVFPNLAVVKFLLECGANVNAKNESRSTPLHIASNPYNYDGCIVKFLLDNGAHLDQPNRAAERPIYLIAINSYSVIPLMNYTTLKCIAATAIIKKNIPYEGQIPKTLEDFVQLHRC